MAVIMHRMLNTGSGSNDEDSKSYTSIKEIQVSSSSVSEDGKTITFTLPDEIDKNTIFTCKLYCGLTRSNVITEIDSPYFVEAIWAELQGMDDGTVCPLSGTINTEFTYMTVTTRIVNYKTVQVPNQNISHFSYVNGAVPETPDEDALYVELNGKELTLFTKGYVSIGTITDGGITSSDNVNVVFAEDANLLYFYYLA